jgi:hypothetical protein
MIRTHNAQEVFPRGTHLGLEPIHKGDNVRVLELLQHLQLVVDHALIPADILLQDNLDRNFLAITGFRLAHNSVCTCTERTAELVKRPNRGIKCE